MQGTNDWRGPDRYIYNRSSVPKAQGTQRREMGTERLQEQKIRNSTVRWCLLEVTRKHYLWYLKSTATKAGPEWQHRKTYCCGREKISCSSTHKYRTASKLGNLVFSRQRPLISDIIPSDLFFNNLHKNKTKGNQQFIFICLCIYKHTHIRTYLHYMCTHTYVYLTKRKRQ